MPYRHSLKVNEMVKKGQSIEVAGKNTQEAIETALNKLGVHKNRVKIKILSEEKKGLFGMEGARQAKVKVTIIK